MYQIIFFYYEVFGHNAWCLVNVTIEQLNDTSSDECNAVYEKTDKPKISIAFILNMQIPFWLNQYNFIDILSRISFFSTRRNLPIRRLLLQGNPFYFDFSKSTYKRSGPKTFWKKVIKAHYKVHCFIRKCFPKAPNTYSGKSDPQSLGKLLPAPYTSRLIGFPLLPKAIMM